MEENKQNGVEVVDTKLYFKHHKIATFRVGQFLFSNHICAVPQEDKKTFFALMDTLHPQDKTAITEVAKQIPGRSLADARASRGAINADAAGLTKKNAEQAAEIASLKATLEAADAALTAAETKTVDPVAKVDGKPNSGLIPPLNTKAKATK